jgi:hypothetical protein
MSSQPGARGMIPKLNLAHQNINKSQIQIAKIQQGTLPLGTQRNEHSDYLEYNQFKPKNHRVPVNKPKLP